MTVTTRTAGVPPGALIHPTLMLTGKSAAAVYAQPAAELSRLAQAGVVIKLARGFYAAIPLGKRGGDWLPSMEAICGGLASAVYGPGFGALWGLSAARIHGALPRALATGHVCGPKQHLAITLMVRPGAVLFRKRDPARLDLESIATELGACLVTSVEQTILDLSSQPFVTESEPRVEAVLNLMALADQEALADLSGRVRGVAALGRARRLFAHA